MVTEGLVVSEKDTVEKAEPLTERRLDAEAVVLSEPELTLEIVGRKELVKDTLVVLEPETVAEDVVVSE